MKIFLVYDKSKEKDFSRLIGNFKRNKELTLVASPRQADIIAVIGGDGLMTRAAKKYARLQKPLYGINRGTYGFLMNDHSDKDNLLEAFGSVEWLDFPLIEAEIHFLSGRVKHCLAFNDIYTKTTTAQAAKHRIFINGLDILGQDGLSRNRVFIGDGLIVCTPGGSTAYNRAAHGPILDPKTAAFCLTPVSPFLPAGFIPQPVNSDAEITIEMVEEDKRRHLIIADNVSFRRVAKVIIRRAAESVTLGFKDKNSYFLKTLKLRFPWLKKSTEE